MKTCLLCKKPISNEEAHFGVRKLDKTTLNVIPGENWAHEGCIKKHSELVVKGYGTKPIPSES